ncbi:MAG: efflux RND transporter periplasmic adaptor subunit [Gammaproteobacteria bacterium]|nr:efflux RND transporter periplasmic adaptor subunit [Gammaproteobacteria bacterium]
MRTWFGIALWAAYTGVAAAPPPIPVIVATVEEAPFEDRIEALGTLRANESVALTASVTEKVGALHFDDGDRVEKGQLLAELVNAEQRAQLLEARALAGEAERQYRRVKSLVAQGTAAESLLDERLREWETARARVAAIESRLANRLVKAPFAGVVGLRNISVGALVEPGDLITTLDDLSVMKLDLAVPSIHLATLVPGLGVEAVTSAYGESRFSGEVHSIDSRVDPVTRSVVVRVLLDNAEGLLKPGMLMQVTLRKNPRRTLVILEGALMPVGRDQFVLVAVPAGDGHRAERRAVRIGSRRTGEVEVLEGLAAGEQVITHGTLRARPGQPVTVRAVDDGSRSLAELLRGDVAESAR